MKKILLIDDSDTYTWCLQKYLQHRGYPVKTACTLKEARAAIQEEMPLVVCCDLDLPDGSGMDFLDKVRAADKELHFVLASCHDKDDYEQEAKHRIFEDKEIDLILCDLELPDGTAMELFHTLRRVAGMFQMKNPPVRLLPFFILTENNDLAIFYMAVQDDCLRKNPFDFQINEVINDDTVPKVPLTPTQENELLDFMQNDPVYAKYYDEVVILLETGLRISELCGLTPADLNFEKRFVNVDHQLLRSTEDGYYIEAPKTESGFRQVPMSAAAYEAFERVLKKRRDGRCIKVDGYKDFLFLNRDGLPKTAVNYDAMFKCLAKKYNKCHKEPLPDVMTPHTMRHTFCTRMANAGMNPKALQYIMGHANIVMTLNYYAHATFHSAQEEMERLQAKAKTTAEAKPEPAAESAEETKAA
ncbi:response regulator [Ruminococcus sp. AF19-29]|nr:response regulator [Ruminococcus sp. AF19-29]